MSATAPRPATVAVPTLAWPTTRVTTPPTAPVSSLASTLGAAPAEIGQAIPIYPFLPGYAAVPSRFMPVLAKHAMALLYALSSSPMALPLPSVHVPPALLEMKAAPHLAPDATALAFGSGSTLAAALTHTPAGDPHSPGSFHGHHPHYWFCDGDEF
ncbi:hypothetical protein E2562_004399 [Oryza meyeriana var. granulata]|uniref:Uncharacterized protein n=1 Tax=Oryza meyeriana var. granulata TaxID=110450 RepID=A0A6G1D103_9ORYZ|nr:hypothetical protein E2562_004399 [Oryza meyeriana var. granulata]